MSGSCRLNEATIFDRPVRIVEERLPVPEVERHEPGLGIEGRFVEIDGGVRLWVEEIGEGPPLLLIPGGPGTSLHYFHPHMSAAASFSRLIYVDLRGVGLSDRVRPEGGYSVASAVSDLESLRQALGLESWAVLGNSFGGVIAQQYAVDHPGRLDALVLTSSAVAMDEDLGIGVRQRDFMSAREIARLDELYTVDGRRVAPVHGADFSEAEQREVIYNAFVNGDWKRRHLCRMSDEEIARFARYEFVHDANYYPEMIASWQALDLRTELGELRTPTLIIEGRWDLAFAEWKPERMRRLFPR
ncbi:MAG: alpha/beta hydrolase, partial [Longimicrobiales bacterium]